MDFLKADNISYQYPGHAAALSQVSLSMKKGEKWAVIGSNGSGKSTFLQILNGLRKPDAGTVWFQGTEVSNRSLRDKTFLALFRSHVGYVFQDAGIQLFCPTVFEELSYGPRQMRLSEEEMLARVHETMAFLRIAHLAERPPYMLSGGEKKRVAMGAVLTSNPEGLLLDEPMNGLDPRNQCFMAELLLSLHEAGKTIVMATHDLSLVEEMNCQTAVLSEAHTLEKTGPSQDILNDTDLLIRVNLVHEHRHYHGARLHKHVHSQGHHHG